MNKSQRLGFTQILKIILKPVRRSKWVVKLIRMLRYQIKPNADHTKENLHVIHMINQQLQKNGGKMILVFPVIPWLFRWQRPQHLLSMFAKDGYVILYLPMDLRYRTAYVKDSQDAFRYLTLTRLAENVFETGIFSKGLIDIVLDDLGKEQVEQFTCTLQSFLSKLEFQQIIYLSHFPGWNPLMFNLKRLYTGKIVFDCMDEHGGFNYSPKHIGEAENELLKEADLVVTSSCLLNEKAKKQNPNTILIRNGTEFEHFHELKPNGVLESLTSKPIIGYYGAISEWFDFEILKFCATKKPQWNFVMIGSTFSMDLSTFSSLPNVFFLGEKPYQELPGYIYYFDVCIIPFRIIPLTLATNPVKFYEYISSGKPVVSVALPELVQYSENCYLAEGKEDFLRKAEIALSEKDDAYKKKKRIDLAKDNCWYSRYNHLAEAIQKS